MKKKLTLGALLIVVIIGIACAIYWFFPRTVALSTEGFKYRLGQENMEFGEPLQVNVNGKIYRRLGGNVKFMGDIQLKGENTPAEQNHWQVDLLIHETNGKELYVRQDGKMFPEMIGTIFINQDFSEMTITVMEKNEDGNGGKWSGGDGLMVSAPATNREAALAVSNSIMKGYLKKGGAFELE
ncbi:hypothetical protein ACX93W_15240 [Paenibacillus sp. CAU 1782]